MPDNFFILIKTENTHARAIIVTRPCLTAMQDKRTRGATSGRAILFIRGYRDWFLSARFC
jgi:hypothetical protein